MPPRPRFVDAALGLLKNREAGSEERLKVLRGDIQVGRDQLARGEAVSSDEVRDRRDERRSRHAIEG